ncbi:MAG: hypothetical protein J6Z28_05085 [Succinivibrio sp.]|nr:hypothetical protein [Succinivibrio sp.]
MSIDANALTSINNAIASFSSSNTQNSVYQNNVQTLSDASASISTETRYKKAFEEKLKKATGSDEVEISKDAIDALKKYNLKGNEDTEKTDKSDKTSSSDVSYTYDYMTLKKQREQNLAKIEKEVNDRYGPASSAQDESLLETEEASEAPVETSAAVNTQPRTEPQSGSADTESPANPQGRPQNSSDNAANEQTQNDSNISGADEMSESASLSNV